MKKAFLYFYFLTLFISSALCQALPLIIDTTLTWSVLYGEYPPNAVYERTEYFKISDNSIINDIDYKKIYSSRYPLYEWTFDNYFIREDSQKVYLLDEYNSERVLYDFSLKVGDTIELQNIFEELNEWIVYDIDSIEIDGVFRKQLHLGFDSYCCDDKWIEGIGSILGLTTPGNIVIDFSTELLCVNKDSQNIFSNPRFDTCYIYYVYDPIWIKNIYYQTSKELFKLSPNPVINEIFINSNLEKYEYQLYDVSGKLIYSGQLHKDSVIDINNIAKGFYIIALYTKENRLIAKVIKK